MNFIVYILFSKTKNRYYIGFTADTIEERIRKHNANHSGFTGNVNDWQLVHAEYFDSKQLAQKREKQIKNWKSRKMIPFLYKILS